jgi:hypothetical protein
LTFILKCYIISAKEGWKMKILTTYVCEICGNKSRNKEEIERCEAKGRSETLKVGERILVNFGDFPNNEEALDLPYDEETFQLAVVTEIGGGHEAVYKVRAIPPFGPMVEHWGKYMSFPANPQCQKCRSIFKTGGYTHGLEECERYHACFENSILPRILNYEVPESKCYHALGKPVNPELTKVKKEEERVAELAIKAALTR